MVEQFFNTLFITCFLFYCVGLLSGFIIGYLKGKYLDKPKIHRDHFTDEPCGVPADPLPSIRRAEENAYGIPTGRIKHPTAQELRERKKSKKEREADKAMEESLKESGL